MNALHMLHDRSQLTEENRARIAACDYLVVDPSMDQNFVRSLVKPACVLLPSFSALECPPYPGPYWVAFRDALGAGAIARDAKGEPIYDPDSEDQKIRWPLLFPKPATGWTLAKAIADRAWDERAYLDMSMLHLPPRLQSVYAALPFFGGNCLMVDLWWQTHARTLVKRLVGECEVWSNCAGMPAFEDAYGSGFFPCVEDNPHRAAGLALDYGRAIAWGKPGAPTAEAEAFLIRGEFL